MSLTASDLADGLTIDPQGDYSVAAQLYADAYAAYAADARSPMTGFPLNLTAPTATLQSALAAAFSAGFDANATAEAMDAAFTAFWLSPPVAFTGSPPGTVTAVTGAGTLAPALLAAWQANTSGDASTADSATQIADAIDAFTRTVIVTHPVVPTPVVGPIT